jgi:hypothetical protein
VASWRISGPYIEFCSCDPGCGCNFRGFPTSEAGNCEAFIGVQVEEGNFDGVDLTGSKVAWALWWPGAIHEGGGHGHAYIDCESEEQFDALRRIYRGEEGHALFEIFNSTFTEASAVDRATVEVTVDGKNSRFSVDGVGEAAMETLRNPVTQEPNEVRIVKPNAFIWSAGEIAQSERLRVDLPEMSFQHSGKHGVFSRIDWANA